LLATAKNYSNVKTTPTIHQHEAQANGNIQEAMAQLKRLVYYLNSRPYD